VPRWMGWWNAGDARVERNVVFASGILFDIVRQKGKVVGRVAINQSIKGRGSRRRVLYFSFVQVVVVVVGNERKVKSWRQTESEDECIVQKKQGVGLSCNAAVAMVKPGQVAWERSGEREVG